MRKITTISIIILSFLLGSVFSEINPFVEARDCDNIPTTHIFYLKTIKECLENTDRQIKTNLDATNNVFFSEIQRLESKINAR